MKKTLLCLLFILTPTLFFGAAGPAPLEKGDYPLHVLSNINCNISMLFKRRTPEKNTHNKETSKFYSEPGKDLTIYFKKNESFFLKGIFVQPERNLPAEYKDQCVDRSKPEYGLTLADPPIIGEQPLVMTINETYKVKGYTKEQGVLFVHYLICALQKTEDPRKTEPLFEIELFKKE